MERMIEWHIFMIRHANFLKDLLSTTLKIWSSDKTQFLAENKDIFEIEKNYTVCITQLILP